MIFSPPKVENLRHQVEEDLERFVVRRLFPEIAINEYGQVIGRMPSVDSDDPKEVEEAKRAQMFKLSQLHRQINVQVFVEPVREVLNIEHRGSPIDFLPLLTNHPFVPLGREFIFAEGLSEGMRGNFLVMCSLLIPQIENSIRYLLQESGIITSGFSSSRIQDERPLTVTLYLSELEGILGSDLVFDLQGLLVERFGQNLRNRLAHGLMHHAAFYSIEASYLWWLTLRIICIPLINKKVRKDKRGIVLIK